MRRFNKLSFTSAFVLVCAVVGMPVFALAAPNAHANAQATQNVTTATSTTGQPIDAGSKATEKKAAAQTKLADAKLKACQNRERAIDNLMGRIADRGQKQLDLFSSIATKTETFYTEKGKTLSNYETLVSDVSAKKDAAQTAVDTVKANSVTFKCDGSDPKGMATTFKDSLKTEIAALKDYKTSVKNLIVGVKSVQSATTSTENKNTEGN
jgi:hypothetical protein